MGNPLQYRDGLSFTWKNGRQLATVTQNNETLAMTYDCNGLRTQKGGTHYYYDSENNLIAMSDGTHTLFFYYDENGNATSFSLGGNMYFYVKNLQGDIINIVDENGSVVVRYDYDVLGKITAVKNGSNQTITDPASLAFLNPLRYRGYVCDDETGLYYLQSRYYDPVTGRFLNADIYIDTGSGSPLSTNMFAYCENDMLYRIDGTGRDACWIQSPSSVPFLGGFIHFGHTSLLLQKSPGHWFYFYWSGETVQLLYLHTTTLSTSSNSKKGLDADIKKILAGCNKLFGNLLKANGKDKITFQERYTQSLWVSGNFTKSIEEIRKDMIKQSKDHKYLLLKFKYYGIDKYESWVLVGNCNYCLLFNNCMHASVYYLQYGTLYNIEYNYIFHYRLNYCERLMTPAFAFDTMVYGMDERDTVQIGRIKY